MVRINGYLNPYYEPPAPFVEVVLALEKLDLHYSLDLLIDPGASATILLDKDVEAVGIEVKKLEKHRKKITGIGGAIRNYSLNDAELVFKSEDGKLHKERLDILNKFRFVYDAPPGRLYLER